MLIPISAAEDELIERYLSEQVVKPTRIEVVRMALNDFFKKLKIPADAPENENQNTENTEKR